MSEMYGRGADRVLLAAGTLLLAAWTAPVLAQPASPPAPASAPAEDADEEQDFEVDELVVTAAPREPRGSVIGDIPPEIQLGPREIRGLGVSSVAELLEALEPQIGSGRGGGGRPVTLLNGKRISSFAEIRDLPPEAIVRIDILPEEVALKYGYRADQRVVNFVLRPRFRATTVEAGARVATAGGRETFDGDLNQLRIRRDTRFQLDLKASHSTPLLESERDLVARSSGAPFDPIGNITAPAGGEIDPALSALAGQPVTIAGVPTAPATLAGFASLAGGRTSDVGAYRTLLAPTTSAAVNAVLSRPIGEVSATLNGTLEMAQTESRLGLPTSTLLVPAGNPFSPFGRDVALNRFAGGLDTLRRTNDSWAAHLGLSLNGTVSDWRWSFTGNAERADSQSITETGLNTTALQAAVAAGAADPFAQPPAGLLLFRAPDLAHAVVTSADAQALFNGSPMTLPAGKVSTALTVAAETRQLESGSLRSGVTRQADLSRHLGRAQANVDVPIASRRNEVLTGLGNLSLNFNAAVEQLSDFGTLTTLGAGINWSPIEPLRIIASVTDDDGAPSIQQLGDPEIPTPGVRVFDFTRGETVEVVRIDGGNPGLSSDMRRTVKLGLTLKPWSERQLTFRADYTRTRTRDLISTFPAATAEIEAAFPGRFVRDADGRLTQIDVRPVNFARQARDELRWGFNYSRPLRGARPAGFQPGQGREGRPDAGGRPRRARDTDGAPATPAPASGEAPPAPIGEAAGPRRFPGGGGGGRRAGGGGFRGGGGSLQLALFHTVRLKDEILIRPGVPVLDFLNGSAAGSGGGSPQHRIDLQAGATRNGYGARLTGRWQSGTEVRGRGGEDLRFSDLTKVNLRLFADLAQQPIARRHTWLRGARVALAVDNLFDAHPEVRDASGVTPASYQPDLLEPLGRTVRLSVRKVFF